LQIQRFCCKECGGVWQSDIPFTHGEVSYTYRFSRYVLDLLRMGNTTKDVAQHLHVGWNMVKEIHKKYLKSRYSHSDIKHVRRIGIDEFAIRKGHVYKTIVVDLDTGRIIHVGDGKGKEALEGFWKHAPVTNAMLEGINNKIKVMKRRAYIEMMSISHCYCSDYMTKPTQFGDEPVRYSSS
jgi:transposase